MQSNSPQSDNAARKNYTPVHSLKSTLPNVKRDIFGTLSLPPHQTKKFEVSIESERMFIADPGQAFASTYTDAEGLKSWCSKTKINKNSFRALNGKWCLEIAMPSSHKGDDILIYSVRGTAQVDSKLAQRRLVWSQKHEIQIDTAQFCIADAGRLLAEATPHGWHSFIDGVLDPAFDSGIIDRTRSTEMQELHDRFTSARREPVSARFQKLAELVRTTEDISPILNDVGVIKSGILGRLGSDGFFPLRVLKNDQGYAVAFELLLRLGE